MLTSKARRSEDERDVVGLTEQRQKVIHSLMKTVNGRIQQRPQQGLCTKNNAEEQRLHDSIPLLDEIHRELKEGPGSLELDNICGALKMLVHVLWMIVYLIEEKLL